MAFRPSSLIPVGFLAGLISLCTTILAADVEVAKLPLEAGVTSMALSEDGRYLIVASEAANKLTIVDALTLRPIRQIDCMSPRHVLSVDDRVYVANFGHGKVSVFDTGDWKMVKQLDAGMAQPHYLSAPGEPYFDGRILVSVKADADGYEAHLVTVETNERERIHSEGYMAGATFAYKGESLIVQSPFDGRSSGAVVSYELADKLGKGGGRGPGQRGSQSGTPLLRQPSDQPMWFGGTKVAIGNPPMVSDRNWGDLVIADEGKPVFYAFDGDSVRCFAANEAFTELGSRQVSIPDDMTPFSKRGSSKKWRGNELYHHLAVTSEKQLSLFILDEVTNSIFAAVTTPFQIPAAVVNAPKFPSVVVAGKNRCSSNCSMAMMAANTKFPALPHRLRFHPMV